MKQEILHKPCGDYQTNCYIYKKDDFELIIDPGYNALEWIKENVQNPLAILNTHGHFDHIWDNEKVQQYYNIPIYVHEKDNFLLQNDIFGTGMPPSKADILINHENTIKTFGVDIKYMHFAGHTPGCCMVQVNDVIFSGDFIFKNSVGRWDFPYSNAEDMKQSLVKFKDLKNDSILYPGHGEWTNISKEQGNIDYWINVVSS